MPAKHHMIVEVTPEIDWTDAIGDMALAMAKIGRAMTSAIQALNAMADAMAKIDRAMTDAAQELTAAQERRIAASETRRNAAEAHRRVVMDDDALVASEIVEGVARAVARWVYANRDSGAATVAACDDADEPGHEASR